MLEAKFGTKRYPVFAARIISEVGQVTSAHLSLGQAQDLCWRDMEEMTLAAVELTGSEPRPVSEQFLVRTAGLRGGLLDLEAVGMASPLTTTGAVRVWRGQSPAGIAREIVASAGLTATIDLDGVAGEVLDFVLQPGGTDWDFLCDLLSQCGGAIIERDGAIHLTSAPCGADHDLYPREAELRPTWFGHAAGTPRGLRQHLEQDGNVRAVEADGGSSAAWLTLAAGVASASDAEAGLLGLRRASEGGVEVRLDLARPDIAVGDRVTLSGAPGPMAVVRREIRFDGSGPPSCHLVLVEADRFASWGTRRTPRTATPLLQAVVRSGHLEDRVGWCGVSLVDDPNGTGFPAQLTSLGGGGAGIVLPPAEGAIVMLGFVGAGLSPRPVVLAVLRDAANNAHAASRRDPKTALLAVLPGGGSIALSRKGEADSVEVDLGSGKTRIRVDEHGSIEITGETVTLTASSLAFEAKDRLSMEAGTMTLSADRVEVSGTTIELVKGQ